MAEQKTLARPYARAAFAVALAEKNLESWADLLSTASELALQEKVKAVLQSPSLTAEQKTDVFTKVLGSDQGTFNKFIFVLAENGRLSLLPHIRDLYLGLKAQQESTVDVTLTSAYELDKETSSQLVVALGKSLNRSVKLNTKVDASLLGGALIRTGDTVIDGSVRGRLSQLTDLLHAQC